MSNRLMPAVAVLLCLSPAWASNPGEPLDCSDWQFFEPGLSCTVFAPSMDQYSYWRFKGTNLAVDNEGDLFILRSGSDGTSPIRLVRFDGSTETVVAQIQDRPGEPGTTDTISTPRGACAGAPDLMSHCAPHPLAFDPVHGRFFIRLGSGCSCPSSTCNECNYAGLHWIAAIEGFTTLFEVLQTYTPDASSLGFRVPYMPEGLERADWFDTYYGDVERPIDFAKAKPLQCGYPATPPTVGDYLTVADTVPNPAPGKAVYYLTATTFQGQTRIGRKTGPGGVKRGRDPSGLPPCASP